MDTACRPFVMALRPHEETPNIHSFENIDLISSSVMTSVSGPHRLATQARDGQIADQVILHLSSDQCLSEPG